MLCRKLGFWDGHKEVTSTPHKPKDQTSAYQTHRDKTARSRLVIPVLGSWEGGDKWNSEGSSTSQPSIVIFVNSERSRLRSKVKCFKVSCSLQTDELWVSGNYHLLQQEASLKGLAMNNMTFQ